MPGQIVTQWQIYIQSTSVELDLRGVLQSKLTGQQDMLCQKQVCHKVGHILTQLNHHADQTFELLRTGLGSIST